ncbi:lytic murein transglycosylase [Candidatus Parcubacteria bacterium]|nr:lytic murein transglycosylase [Candidatus Parcubacteria bacterium]
MNIISKSKIVVFSNNHKAMLLCGLFVLFFVSSFAIVRSAEVGESEVNTKKNDERIERIKEEIKQTQGEIDKYAEEVKAQQQKSRTLQRDIAIYNNKVKKNELELKETKLSIQETDLEMDEIKERLREGEKKVDVNRESLRDLIRLLYSYEQDSVLEILMTRDNLSDFFNEIDAIESVKSGMFQTIVDLKAQKEEMNFRGEELEDQQEEKGKLIQIKAYQNDSLQELMVQKNELLDVTKGNEKQFQQLLEENKNILPSLRAELYDLQSLGNKIKFDDAYSAAKHIGARIGVRPAYLLGILKVESNLGKNTGSGNWEDDMYGCYMRLSEIARTSKRKAYYIKRANTEKNAFFSIIDKLGIDPYSVKVSKEPTYGCGGAMGPAQFIPSTWVAYEQRVSEITGHYPPSPWDLADAMAAMAVKVSDIPGVVGGNYDAEYEAAGRYLGGGNWRSKNLFFYPNKVMLYANLYEEELNGL